LRVKLIAAALIALPLIGGGAAFAGEGSEHMIPPAKVGKYIDPHGQAPIDFSRVEITRLTPADKFVNATTPLALAMGLGSIALVVYTLTQGAKENERE
jgi:hypothetical protein